MKPDILMNYYELTSCIENSMDPDQLAPPVNSVDPDQLASEEAS